MSERENRLGLNGFGFVEFAAPHKALLQNAFETLGFTEIAKHNEKDISLYRQGDIDFLLNAEKTGAAAEFAEKHGPCASAMAFRVADSQRAYEVVLDRGGRPARFDNGGAVVDAPALQGIGGASLFLVDDKNGIDSIYEQSFTFYDHIDRHPVGCGFHTLDHLTHNVFKGKMEYWADYYERLFDFFELRYFDIKGKKTGLLSKAMMAPDGKIRIPLNEESSAGGGQIEEYLRMYKGEGIQHIALACDDLYVCCENIARNGIGFMPPPPDAYYEMLDDRLPNHGESIDKLKRHGILVDGTTEGGEPRLLLQIFSLNMIGPIFFEFIQRKKDEGFGEGNFTALFDSIEQDQIQRGVLS